MPDPFHPQSSAVFLAPVAPPGREAEVTFISGVAADATVAATSFGAWAAFQPYPSIPAQYNPYYSYTTKLGDPTLQLAGTPAVVTYQFDTDSNWSDDEKGAWGAALALWSAEVAITFTLAAGPTADLTFYKQPLPGTLGRHISVLSQRRALGHRQQRRERSRAGAFITFDIYNANTTPRAIPNRSSRQFRRQQRFLFRPDP